MLCKVKGSRSVLLCKVKGSSSVLLCKRFLREHLAHPDWLHLEHFDLRPPIIGNKYHSVSVETDELRTVTCAAGHLRQGKKLKIEAYGTTIISYCISTVVDCKFIILYFNTPTTYLVGLS